MKLLADIEIYVNGIATGQIQNLNAWVDVARAEIMEKYQPGEHGIPYHRLTEEDKQSLIRIASKSDFMKSHISRRGKRK